MQTFQNSAILLIGGFDPSNGAGISADLKICNHFKIPHYSVITNIAVQNHNTGFTNFALPPKIFEEQLKAIFLETKIEFCKIGMIGNLKLCNILIKYIKKYNLKVILDTPLKATNGFILQDKKIIQKISPFAFLITPNNEEFKELIFLSSIKTNILIKSFNKTKNKIIDKLILKSKKEHHFSSKILNLEKTVRGTGCSLAASICVFLYLGFSLEDSIKKGRQIIYKGLKTANFKGKKGIMYF